MNKISKLLTCCAYALSASMINKAYAQVSTFNYTGSAQTYTVPAGVTAISVSATGAAGGLNSDEITYPSRRGYGACVNAVISVTPGQVLTVNIGGKGGDGALSTGGAGGWNGGGAGSNGLGAYSGGGGGGSSDITYGVPLVVAGGGGGAGENCSGSGDPDRGGDAGGLSGTPFTGEAGAACGSSVTGGGGGYSTGGVMGIAAGGTCSGCLGSAGNNSSGANGGDGGAGSAGGGGGGGFGGGGGGQWSGGGGGGNYAGDPNVYFVSETRGCNTANDGSVIITPFVISGPDNVCQGASPLYTTSVTGGAWSSYNTAIATIAGDGTATTVGAGADTIYYTISSTPVYQAMLAITVNPVPIMPAGIGGTLTVCEGGATTLLSDVTGGGAWSSDNNTVASIDPSSGMVTGIAAGTATISYTTSTVCGDSAATVIVTVNPLPVTPSGITGTATVCEGGAVTSLADATPGGVWSSDNTSVATVDPSGVVTGVTAGTVTISYTETTVCNSVAATLIVTVNPQPVSPAGISGITTVCEGGATTMLSDATPGGAWSSDNMSVATVDISGTVTGITAGTATISYTESTVCGSIAATAMVTVNPLPVVPGAITGIASVCAGGATTALSNATPGGIWSSDNMSIATVDASGIVTGITAGTVTISYTETTVCTSASATKVVTVNPLPANPGPITGPTSVCELSSIVLDESVPGGSWSISDPSIATLSSPGTIPVTISGLSAGITTISYTTSTVCGSLSETTVITVNPLPAAPAAITGGSTACVGGFTTLADATPGGVWSSDNIAIATVSVSGAVTGVTIGSTTITYTRSNGCGSAYTTKAITVNPLPVAGSITGATAVCQSATTPLSDLVTGGIWNSSNTAVASVNSSGTVTGIGAGVAVISYSILDICGSATATLTMTVNPLPSFPAAISGITEACAGAGTLLADATPGGAWSSSDTTVAGVVSSGAVNAIATGVATISYTMTNGCGSASRTKSYTVNPLPVAGPITGTTVVCVGSGTLLSDLPGGIWTSANNAIATVNSTGGVTGAAQGTTTISYQAENICGTSAPVTITVTINPLPDAGIISGVHRVCMDDTARMSNTITGGTWSSSNTAIATISASGLVKGVFTGTDDIIYTFTNSCGTVSNTFGITVVPAGDCHLAANTIIKNTATSLSVYPNPNNGSFTVLLSSPADEQMEVIITNSVGQKVKEFRGYANTVAEVAINNAPGIYFVSVVTGSERKVVKIIVE